MAIVKGIFVHGIPDDTNADVLRILESTTENGTYSVVGSYEYTHGYRTVEHDTIDTLKWYKIEFYNTSDANLGARSDAIYGGDYDKSKPFVALSTTFDGAGYATASELYSTSHLTEEDVTVSEAQRKLKLARAFIDLVTETQDIDKFSRIYKSDIARRKYNAYMEVLKRGEIYYALALIYKDLADDAVMRNFRNQNSDFDAVSIGQTSVSLTDGNDLRMAEFFNIQANGYAQQALSIIQTLLPTSVPLFYGDGYVKQRFIHPQDIYAYAGSTPATSDDATIEQVSEVLTGSGGSMNSTYIDLSDTPAETASTLSDAVMVVNGVEYQLNTYFDSYNTEVTINAGTGGFGISFYGGAKIRWNHTAANGGFDLTDGDVISVRYWK